MGALGNGLDIEQDDDELRKQRIADAQQKNPINIATPSQGDKTAPLNLPGVTPNPQTTNDAAEVKRLQDTGSGVSQLQKSHPILGGIAKGLDIAGSLALPGFMQAIPGTTLHHMALGSAARRNLGGDIKNDAEQATTAKTQADTGAVPSEIANRQALTAKTTAETESMGQPKPKEEDWSIVPGAQGPNGEPIQQEKNSGQIRFAQLAGATVKQPNEKPDNLDQQYAEAAAKQDHVTMQRILKVKHDLAQAGQAPQRDPRQLAVGPDGKVIELTPGMTVPQGSKTMTGELTNKPSPDEQRRADLAENMNQLEEILNRRADLFGPAAGRWASLKGTIGTDDPDIAALKVIKEQMGMAMVGAHAMRNAQHVETAANSLVNSFNNQPVAIKGAIAAARKSLQTFQNDVNRPANTGSTAAPKQTATGTPQGGGTIRARDPQGKLHEAPAGTPLPAGWKPE